MPFMRKGGSLGLSLFLFVLAGEAGAQEEGRDEARWESAWDPGFWGSPPTCSLDLRAGERRSEGQAEWFGIAVLQIPLTGCRENHVEREKDAPDVETTEVVEPASEAPSVAHHQASIGFTGVPAQQRLLVRRTSVVRAEETTSRLAASGGRSREALVRAESTMLHPGASRHETTASTRHFLAAPGEFESERASRIERDPSDISSAGASATAGEATSVTVVNEGWHAPSLAFVRELVRRAVAASGLPREGEHLGDLAHRARWAGLAPELRLRGAMGLGQSTSLAGTGILPGDTTQRGTSDAVGEVRLTFRLSRLVFDDTESGIARMRLQLLTARQKLVEDALDLYVSWLEAERKLHLSPSEDAEDVLDATVRAEAAALRLDVLTAGWFLAALSRESGGVTSRGSSTSPSNAP